MTLRALSWLLEARWYFGWAPPVWTPCSGVPGDQFPQLLACTELGAYIEKSNCSDAQILAQCC